jgi:carnitine O-acetyltransferase
MNHIIVVRRNQFFVMDLEPNGKRLSTADIKIQFDAIYAMAGNLDIPIGSLTAENRDVWTVERGELLKSNLNKQTLDIIESAAFVVCLDESKPVTKEERNLAILIVDSVECWHGDGRNRFFDKSMQFIVFDNGKAGFNGEHSNMEATITHRCCDWILEKYYSCLMIV